MLKHIPNFLTICRLLVIFPFLMCLYTNHYVFAFNLYVIAGLTDGLDGWLARTFKWKSALGSFMDPLADKLLISCSFIALALMNQLPWWLVLLVFMRDLTIALGVAAWYWFVRRDLAFKPTTLSKINTALQLILVTLCLFQLAFFNFTNSYILNFFIIITAITTAATYFNYVWAWSKKAYFFSQ